MDGKRTVVEEVGGTVDELKVVQEAEARLLVLEVKANHSSGSLSELLLCQLVIRIVLQSYIINLYYLRQLPHSLCQLQCVCRLHGVTSRQSLQSQRLHIGGMRCHICSEVEDHLSLYDLLESSQRAVVDD